MAGISLHRLVQFQPSGLCTQVGQKTWYRPQATTMLWSNLFSGRQCQLCRDKQKLTLVSSSTKRPLSLSGFRAVLSHAQPWGRLAAPLYGNREWEAVLGKPVATARGHRDKPLWHGGGRAERQVEGHWMMSIESVPTGKERKYGQQAGGNRTGWQSIHSKREHLMEIHRWWLCVWQRNRWQGQKGRRRISDGLLRVAEQIWSAQCKEW